MSIYTTEVRFICEMEAGLTESVGFSQISDVIAKARGKIFNFSYPIFDESYRQNLETKILTAFYTREICCETVGLWKLRLQQKLNEIMPYYNQLYLSEKLRFDPLLSDNYKRTGHRTDSTIGNQNENTNYNKNNRLDKNESYSEEVDGRTHETQVSSSKGSTTGNTTSSGKKDGTSSGSGESKSSGTTNSEGTSQNTQTNAYSNTPQNQLSDVSKLKYLTDYRVIGDNGSTTGKVTTSEQGSNSNSGKTSETSSGTGTSAENRQDSETINTDGTAHTDKSGQRTTGETGKEDYTSNRGLSETENSEGDYWETIIGYQGRSATSLLMEYRDSFLNIDAMILKDLEPLFFGLWL